MAPLQRAGAALAVLIGSFLFAAPALADYGPSTPPQVVAPPVQPTTAEVQPAAVSKAPAQVILSPAVLPESRTALPLTGADVAGLVVLGGGLLVVGVAASRAGRRRHAHT